MSASADKRVHIDYCRKFAAATNCACRERGGQGLAAEDRDASRRGENMTAKKSLAASPTRGGFKIKSARK